MNTVGRALSSDEVERVRAWQRSWSPVHVVVVVACVVAISTEVWARRDISWPAVLILALAAYAGITVVVARWMRAKRFATLAPGAPTVILEGHYHQARSGKNYSRPQTLGVHRIQLATNRPSPAEGEHARARAIALPTHPWFNDVPEWLVVDWES